jgi:hypothetical protein
MPFLGGLLRPAAALVLLALFLCSSPVPAGATQRLALVIGINEYPKLKTSDNPTNGQLLKAVADAEIMAEILTELRFDVDIARNVDRLQFLTALERLKRKITPGDTVFLFFAGHGVALSGTNLLLPSDILPVDPDAAYLIRQLSVPETDVIEGLREKGASLVILTLDACRDNPLEEFRRMQARREGRSYRATTAMPEIGIVPRGTMGVFSIYSAGLGQRALDRLGDFDTDRNSVFTRVFAKKLRESGRTLTDVVVSVRSEVTALASRVIDPDTRMPHQQYPAYYDETRGGHIILDGAPPVSPSLAASPSAPPPSSDAAGRADFEFAERINSSEVWEEFLRKYPSGMHAAAARQRLAALTSSPPHSRLPPAQVPEVTALPLPSGQSDAIETVRSFYAALGRADGNRASLLVLPEKRASGPFSASEITKFYGSLTEPLRLTNLISLGENKFQADYTYRMAMRRCEGAAIVTVTRRDGRPLIEGIRALKNC